MRYAEIYDRLVARGQGRVLPGYCESHHIVPKCMGGSNERSNLVQLTPEEHFLAHKLLVKIHPHNPKLVYGLKAMTISIDGRRNNKLIGWARRKYGAAVSARQKGVKALPHVAENLRTVCVGRKAGPEERARRRIANKLSAQKRLGPINNFAGKSHTDESRAKMRHAHTARWTPERRASYSAQTKSQWVSGVFDKCESM